MNSYNIIRDEKRLNHITVNGVSTSQHYSVVNALDKLQDYLKLLNQTPKTIIEIGTLSGGFTTLLANHEISAHAAIHTFDLINKLDNKYVKADHVQHHFVNAFETSLIEDLLAQEGCALLFCDGGNKIKEFNLFAKFLKPGDYIFCHDYVRNKELFENSYKDKVWNWWESNYAAIEPAVISCGLESVLADVFEAAVWGSFKKTVQV
jgi:hypothetical protein